MSYKIGDFVRIEKDGAFFEGHIISGEPGYITLKMTGGGYISGFLEDAVRVEVLESPKNPPIFLVRPSAKNAPAFSKSKSGKKISILSTGGTIACYFNPETGSVIPSFSAADILSEVPELDGFADFTAREVFSLLSENMGPQHWIKLAEAIYEEIQNGADGIIVTHGTDTMAYSAAAISYMIETPVPIVFTGAQKSPDRPSSDNHMNLICAAKVAKSDIAEVMIVMHGSISDDFCFVHRAVKAKKMHTSRRDTFKSINMAPLARIDYKSDRFELMSDNTAYSKRGEKTLSLSPKLETKCAIVKFVPGSSPDILDYYLENDYKGIVLEGVGLGHVSDDWVSVIQKAAVKKIPVIVTSQCIFGATAIDTYETGQNMKKAGAIEAVDQTTEAVFVKMMWLLGQGLDYETVQKKLVEDLRGEISSMIID
ncbi:Glu-tRNA(Gln) amidotransferase subunit GatD [Methanolapillus ohkumae]|uniref:Glutamyl-tRNA(Gln) amidotransferase subunit D n=1 Tax=Methanolapillus ohkumae TaxID=3028298 RepID=A0AA96ZVY5_9EURY|nr:hypothetical protein MsAm2_10060 [Methanosarcinaceae archaeon Am2]